MGDLVALRLEGARLVVMADFFRCLELLSWVCAFLLGDVCIDLTLVAPEKVGARRVVGRSRLLQSFHSAVSSMAC